MTDKFVLNGSAGTYLSTEDINLLDADTAHLQQSIGGWQVQAGAQTFQLIADGSASFGDNALETNLTIAIANPEIRMSGVAAGEGMPVVAGNDYSILCRFRTDIANQEGAINVTWRDAAGTFVGQSLATVFVPVSGSTYVDVTATYTAPAGALFGTVRMEYQTIGGGVTPTGLSYVDVASNRDGIY